MCCFLLFFPNSLYLTFDVCSTMLVKALCFQADHIFVRSFIWTDLVTAISHERLEQSR